jgi:hypothetical protein
MQIYAQFLRNWSNIVKTSRALGFFCLAVILLNTAAFGQTWDWAGQIASYSSTSIPMNQVTAVSVDQYENVYIVGDYGDSALVGGIKVKGIPVGNDMYVAKLNSSGQFAWAKSFGSGDVADQVLDVANDPDGSVYVCAYFTGQIVLDTVYLNGVSISNIVVAKFNSSGAVVWARLVWHANQGPGGLVCDHGYVYAAVNHTLAKYTPDGDTVWTRTAADNGSLPVEYSDIATDSSGNLYLSGEFTGQITYGTTTLHAASITDRDILIVKYDSLGNVLWAKQAGAVSSPIQEDLGRAIAVSKSGYVYVVGQYKGTAFFDADSVKSGNASTGLFIAKYNGDGNLQWVKGGNGPNLSSSNAFNVKVLANEDVLVEAIYSSRVTIEDTTFTLGGGSDVLLLRFAPNGTRLWGKRSNTFAPASWGYGLAVNAIGNSAYAGGQFANSAMFGPTTLTTAASTAFDGWIAKMDVGATGSCCMGKRGNVNGVEIVDLADLSALVGYLLTGNYNLPCYDAANVNGTGIVDLADLSALVSYLLIGNYVLPSCP